MEPKEDPGKVASRGLETLRSTRLYRPGTNSPDYSFASGLWDRPIDRLLAAKYPFLPCRYSHDGYLFRGMQCGTGNSLACRHFGHFAGNNELCQVEQAMDVYFLTHEISDAVTVSRLFDNPADGCIIAVRAGVFNDYLDNYQAAVLAIGDGGIVFRYPFITTPLALSQVDYVFVSPCFNLDIEVPPALAGKIISVPGADRKLLETGLSLTCKQLGITPASPVPGTPFPGSA